MADLSKFESEPRTQLLEELKDVRCVMLASPNPAEHMQPMDPQVDEKSIDDVKSGGAPLIYFYSDRTSDLGQAVLTNPGADVEATLIEKDYQASLKGRIFPIQHDEALIDRFWNKVVASWYPNGKEDPKMLMLCFVPDEVAIWASTGNPLKFLYETAKANLTDSLPNVGDHKVLAA